MVGVVRIHITLTPSGDLPVDVYGSGWTRACMSTGRGFSIVIATAGHVVDVDELERSLFNGRRTTVKVVIAFWDGREFPARREDLRVDRIRDYGEIRVLSPLARQVLPVGHSSHVHPGAPLFTVASPGGIIFGVFHGHLILRDPIPVTNAPRGSWLASLQIGPGASGAPVLDVDGAVVGTVVGMVTWKWGTVSAVIVPLSETQKGGSAR